MDHSWSITSSRNGLGLSPALCAEERAISYTQLINVWVYTHSTPGLSSVGGGGR